METADFRVGGKIFATLREKDGRAVVKLAPDQQQLFRETNPGKVSPVPGGWGRKGWTRIDLEEADADLASHLLRIAWSMTAPKRLKG